MAILNNNTPVTNPITPGNDDRNEWATHYAKYGAGGFEIVANATEKNAISSERRANKMVYQVDTQTLYHYHSSTWVPVGLGNGAVPQSVLDDIAKNQAEISRLKTHPGLSSASIYNYRGTIVPTLSPGNSGYYISLNTLPDNSQTLTLPTGSVEGTIVSIQNEDPTHSLTVAPGAGETLDGHANTSTLNAISLVFLVRTNTGWETGFMGVIPTEITPIIEAIKTKLTGSLHTIDDIQAALKDKLHTFAEIQKEFQDQLHTTAQLDAAYAPKSVEDEVNRLKTNIGDQALPTYVYRDRGIPTLPPTSTQKYKAYYLHIIVLPDNNQVISIPAGIDEGAILSIENNDRNDLVNLQPPTGETINSNAGNYPCGHDTLNFFIKDGNNWVLAYGGIFPNNLTALRTTIQALLPNELNTIDEISAQLKDRLHTFREIQNEFGSQLHTFDAIEADMISKGFSKGFSVGYGTLDTNTPPQDLSWVTVHIAPNAEVIIPATNQGDKYLAVYMPVYLGALVSEIMLNQSEAETTEHDVVHNELDYKVLVLNDPINTNTNNRLSIEFHNQGAINTGITLDDGADEIAGVSRVNITGGKVTPGGSGEATLDITPLEIHNLHGSYVSVQDVKQINCNPPLEIAPSKSGPTTIKPGEATLSIMHDVFEPLHKPSFLAYLAEDEEVVGKVTAMDQLTAKAHHDGKLWFDNLIKSPGVYINADRSTKKYEIEEADSLDPNVSGGTDYLIAFRVHMKGNAPSDGFVRIYLYDDSVDPFEPTGFLMDVNNNPMADQRHYKAGEELGVLDMVRVVNAKGTKGFTCHVVDTFDGNILRLTDRTEGCTGLMIQAITSVEKTGNGLQQFELDTNQNIEFSSHYLGESRLTLAYYNSRPEAPVSYTAGTNFIVSDGLQLINYNGLKVGVIDGHTQIQDDGVHICDFSYGKVFSAEETHMLRGKDIEITVTLVDKDSAFRVGLMKWVGKPDEYTTKIFSSRNNGALVFEANWSQADSLFITEDPVSGDHTVATTFTVPDEANNYAVVIYPVTAQQPLVLKLKELKVDVNPAFIGYVINAPETNNELHLYLSDTHKEFVQDNQGFAALRYTINNTPPEGLPMPCGVMGKGQAKVSLDSTVNQISGSAARGGEGALKFEADGTATISTTILAWNEQISGSTTTFWWARVSPDGTDYTTIPESETSFMVPSGSIPTSFTLKPFKIQVENGERIALRALTDSIDGAFLQSKSPSKPLIKTEVTLEELKEVADDPGILYEADLNTDQFERDLATNKIQLRTSIDGLDLSNAAFEFTHMIVARYDFVSNPSVISLPVDIPNNVTPVLLSIHYRDGDYMKEGKQDYQYNLVLKKFDFAIGVTGKDGQIVLGFLKNDTI